MHQKYYFTLSYLVSSPRRIFLIDGLGGFLSTFILFAVLVRFQEYFGMPVEVVNTLGLIACSCMVYSFACYLFLNTNHRPYLEFIIIANSAYCFLTLSLVCYFYTGLSIWGITYFLIETGMILLLVFIEHKVYQRL